MNIIKITEDKKKYLDLLLLADEQESMINRYLDKGDMYALFDEDLKSVCVVTDEKNKVLELKNLATYPKYQRCGYAKALIDYISDRYKNDFDKLIVGTGESMLTIGIYNKCGFREFDRVKNFFVDNYDYEIFENGVKLVDMIYLKKSI